MIYVENVHIFLVLGLAIIPLIKRSLERRVSKNTLFIYKCYIYNITDTTILLPN